LSSASFLARALSCFVRKRAQFSLTAEAGLQDNGVMKTMPAFLALLVSVSAGAREFTFVITAAEREYRDALVVVPAPKELPERGQFEEGGFFQRDAWGNVVFQVRELKRGAQKRWRAKAADVPAGAKAAQTDGQVTLRVGNRDLLVYQGAETELPRPDIKPIFKRGGYIHPVFSPSGKAITDDYPPNHIHHHGIWAPWTKTVFEGRAPDFWNMGEGKGKVEFVRFGEHWSGPIHSGFTAEQRHIDLTSGKPVVALNESWTVTAYNVGGDYRVFDLVLTQSCASASALQLPKYHYGGLGLRGNWAWNGANNCFFLTSNGETNRVKGNETRGNWCHMGGVVDGTLTGIAVLCHPGNFRAPQPMRLHPSEPFFCYAPSQLGDWAIEPGKPYVARYRFVVKDGAPDPRQLDRLWADYATPPRVEIR
jgi:hypothetical protein